MRKSEGYRDNKDETQKRAFTYEEYYNETKTNLEGRISDHKKMLRTRIGQSIDTLQKLEKGLEEYADNPFFTIPTDLDFEPRITDIERLREYARKINGMVHDLMNLDQVNQVIRGEVKVDVTTTTYTVTFEQFGKPQSLIMESAFSSDDLKSVLKQATELVRMRKVKSVLTIQDSDGKLLYSRDHLKEVFKSK